MPRVQCPKFAIYELVDKETFEERGTKAWDLTDPTTIHVLNTLRAKFGSCTVNDWYWGGKYQWRGLRTARCKQGSKYSMHRLFRAFDCIFKNYTAQQIRDMIKEDEAFWYAVGIRRIENNVSWFHFDTAQTTLPEGKIQWINP